MLVCESHWVDCVWNVMALAQKPDFVIWRNGRVHLNQRGRQFSRLLAAEVCASAVVMLDTPSSEVVWRVLATHCISQFPLPFPSHASPCAITFQLDSTNICPIVSRYTATGLLMYVQLWWHTADVSTGTRSAGIRTPPHAWIRQDTVIRTEWSATVIMILLTYLIAYLLHAAESFLRS